jgi:tetratricopeptide (TPR) repeat protein
VVEDYPDPEALAERVREDLWRLIDETYPADAVPDALTRERMMHEAYGATRQRMYLGGEEYFKALDQAMRAEKFSPVLITGQSGGGKSALLANWVIRWQAEHLETAVILHHLGCGADAADPVRFVTRLMQEIARLTGEEFKPESDPEKQLEQLPQWLALGSVWAEREGRELLLVLDGLDKVSGRKDLRWFPSFLPSGVKLVASCLEGAILQAAKGRLEWRELEVKPFSQADQMLFIGEYLGRYRKSLTAQQTRTLQGHPLSGNPLFLLTVLEELRVFGVHEELDQRLDTLLSSPLSKSEGEVLTVDDVFEHVLARIEEDLGKEVVQAAVEAIWASRGGLLREELLGVAQLTPAAWASLQNALDEGLYESSGRISFGHDYLRKAVEDRYDLTGDRKLNVHRRLADHFAGLPVDARVAEELPWQWEHAGEQEKLKACLTDRALFVAIKERDEYELLGYWVRLSADVNAAYEAAWKEWGLEDEAAAEVGDSLAIFLLLAGCYTTFALGLREELLRLKRAKLGGEHRDTLREIEALATLYNEAGQQHEAIGLQEEVLRLRREKLGAEHPSTLAAMGNLAIFYSGVDRQDDALRLNEEVLRLSREKLGLEDHFVTIAMKNIAVIYRDVGRQDDALALNEEVVRLRREKLGAEHPSTLAAMGNLANSYSDTGRLEEALGMKEEVVRLKREKLGGDHWSTLMAMRNLAVSYSAAGRLEEALELREEVLRLSHERLGPQHHDTLSATVDLAVFNEKASRLGEALGLRKEVLRLSREKWGTEHEYTLSAMNELAMAYFDTDRLAEATELEEEVLRLMNKKLGSEHQDTLTAMQSVALSYCKSGRQQESISLLEEVLSRLHKKLGDNHPDTLRAMLMLATCYSEFGQLEEELSLLDEVLKIVGGTESLQNLGILEKIGEFVYIDDTFERLQNYQKYLEMGLQDRVICYQEEVLRLSQETLGAEHLCTLRAMGKLAAICGQFDRLERALRLKEEHVRLMREVVGSDDWDTLNEMNKLASFFDHSKVNRSEDALKLKEEVLSVRRK